MHSFINLLSRLETLNEAKESPMDRLLPGFQSKARDLAKSRGASSGTREGRLAMLAILFDLDIIDDSVVRMFKNDPSVSRMVDYFEKNGIAKLIKDRTAEIESHIKDQLENKVSFTTGNRTNEAQQRYEANKLNNEIKAAKKVARLERKKETASAMSHVSQVVDEILDSYEQSFSEDYMMEIIVGKESDLLDVANILKYVSRFVDESDVEVDGRYIDAVFSASSKLGRIIKKKGASEVIKEIIKDLKSYTDVVDVKITEPDIDKKEGIMSNLKKASSIEDEEGYEEEAENESDKYLNRLKKDLEQATGESVDVVKESTAVEGTAVYLTEAEKNSILKNLGGAAAATGLAAATAFGLNKAPDIVKPVSSAISSAVSDISAGGNEAFLKRIKNEEDRKRVIAKIENLRSVSTTTRMSRKTDQYQQADSELRAIEDEMRSKYTIPENIHLHESAELTTSVYLVEQAKKDSVRRSKDENNLSFKERYKPKNSYQLEELRRYGL